MDLKKFCELIKVEYCWFLYNYTKPNTNKRNPEYLEFPFCCHLSANLIASYLSVHVDSYFKHNKLINVRYPHSWSSNEKIIIDFTIFQVSLNTEERKLFIDHIITNKEEFIRLINKYDDIFYEKENYDYYKLDFQYEECQLYGVKYAENIRKDPLSVESFMEYIKSAIGDVSSNIKYE